VQTRQSFQILG